VSDDKLDFLIQALPANFYYQERHVPNLTKDLMGRIRHSGLGLYTFRFDQMFGQADDVFFCRVDSLRTDLMDFFEKIGAASDALRGYVLGLDKKNISEHVHYSAYYTPELTDLVSIRDRRMVERFGFKFETRVSEKEAPPPVARPTRRAIPATV
jgi:hypothetical protein